MKGWKTEQKLNDGSNLGERNEKTEPANKREKKSLTQRPGVSYGLSVNLITCGQLRSTVLDTWTTFYGGRSAK